WWLSGMSWTNIHFAFLPSLLLAATMSSTDSASVFGILGSQKVQLKQNLRPMLELESGSNDPMAYMLTILLIETITLGGDLKISTLMCQLVLQFVVGGAVGYGLGKGSVWLVKKYVNMNTNGKSVDEAQSSSMLTIMLIGCAFYTFVLTDWLKGNGYLAVYICGIVLGNSQIPYRRGICRFVGSMSWLGQIVVFLMLGLLVNPHEMVDVAAVSILIGAFMILAGRPLSVMICLLPFRRISVKAKAFVSWVGLRGAVPIIFATYPVIAGVEGSSQLFNIVFFVTLLSLLVQGTTVISFAKKLKIAEEPSVEESDFGVELSEELSTSLHTMIVTKEHLETAETLRDMNLPKGQLVMMIRRNNQHIIPNGRLKLKAGDALLIIEENEPVMPQE
ncbi:MAG: potassium/proton antiporter, partial [Bacteroidaceae bacterium]|nr:potassium/proton antiporter [Bacteroidaceae bacterium]